MDDSRPALPARNPMPAYNAVPPPLELINDPERRSRQFLEDYGRDRRAERRDIVTPPRRIPRARPDGRNREEMMVERGRRGDFTTDSQTEGRQQLGNRR